MSAENAQQMLQLFQQDQALVDRIAGAPSRDAALNQTVELGKEQGLDFTVEEFARELEARGMAVGSDGNIESLSETVGESGELSEEALESVSGGWFVQLSCRGNW